MRTRNNYSLQARPQDYGRVTVGDLREILETLPDNLPIVFLSPEHGSFGSEHPYNIVSVEKTEMPRMTHTIPAIEYEDEDTGEKYTTEEETQVWEAWRGVVIQGG